MAASYTFMETLIAAILIGISVATRGFTRRHAPKDVMNENDTPAILDALRIFMLDAWLQRRRRHTAVIFLVIFLLKRGSWV